jgi:hypothetical protein
MLTMRESYQWSIRFVAFVCELVVLGMFYSATMLDPFPFDWSRVTAILLTGIVSAVLAYISAAGFNRRVKHESRTWKRLVLRPPLLVWVAAVGFTAIQFLWALQMWYLATRR